MPNRNPLVAISPAVLTSPMSDEDKLSLLAISGFHTPRNSLAECDAPQLPVVVRAEDLTLEAAQSKAKFNISIQRKIPPLTTDIPHGVLLSIPLYYLASIFVFSHGLHGHSMRLRLISPTRAFKLGGGSPAYNRYMLDECGKPIMLYPCHLNDHFDLLGIFRGREVVLQISTYMSMEVLVDWAARLKDTAASENIPIQVLFDNPETGRVSQLQDLPARLQPSPEAQRKNRLMNHTHLYTSLRSGSAAAPHQPAPTSTNLKQDRFTPYAKRHKWTKNQSKKLDEVDEWDRRQRLMRPNSPSRYYRPCLRPPEDLSRFYRPAKFEAGANVFHGRKVKVALDKITVKAGEETRDGSLSDGSTICETPQGHQEDVSACNDMNMQLETSGVAGP